MSWDNFGKAIITTEKRSLKVAGGREHLRIDCCTVPATRRICVC